MKYLKLFKENYELDEVDIREKIKLVASYLETYGIVEPGDFADLKVDITIDNKSSVEHVTELCYYPEYDDIQITSNLKNYCMSITSIYFIDQIIEYLREKYPEFEEGEAMGFFSIKESYEPKLLNLIQSYVESYGTIEIYDDVADVYVISLCMSKGGDEVALSFVANNPDDYEIEFLNNLTNVELLKGLVEKLRKMYPEFEEGSAMGFFSMNEENADFSDEANRRSKELLTDFFLFVKVNGGEVEFDTYMRIITKDYGSFEVTKMYIQDNEVLATTSEQYTDDEEIIKDFDNTNMDDWAFPVLQATFIALLKTDKYMDFIRNKDQYEEGEAMGFFSMNESNSFDLSEAGPIILVCRDLKEVKRTCELLEPAGFVFADLTPTKWFQHMIDNDVFLTGCILYINRNPLFDSMAGKEVRYDTLNMFKMMYDEYKEDYQIIDTKNIRDLDDIPSYLEGNAMGFFSMK